MITTKDVKANLITLIQKGDALAVIRYYPAVVFSLTLIILLILIQVSQVDKRMVTVQRWPLDGDKITSESCEFFLRRQVFFSSHMMALTQETST